MQVDERTQDKRKKRIGAAITVFMLSIPIIGIIIFPFLFGRLIGIIAIKSSNRWRDYGILFGFGSLHGGLLYYFWSSVSSRSGGDPFYLTISLLLIIPVNYMMIKMLSDREVYDNE